MGNGERRAERGEPGVLRDRKSTRLNSSHQIISYAVFCLKKKKQCQLDIKRSVQYKLPQSFSNSRMLILILRRYSRGLPQASKDEPSTCEFITHIYYLDY